MNKRSDVRAKGQMTRRLLAVLTLATIGLVATVTAAQAQVTTNEQVPLAFAGFVPCANGGAGEILSGTIEVHNLITSTVNDNNTSDRFQFQPHGTMVGRSPATSTASRASPRARPPRASRTGTTPSPT